MKRLPLFLALLSAALPARAEPEERQTIRIKTMTAQMKYDETEFTVRPGVPVEIVFENGDDLPHNLVFCTPGTDVVALSMKQMEKPEEALKRNWLPEDSRILVHSKMLNPREKETFRFTAPSKPGNYPYVCTFPGHAMTMKGEMKVIPTGEGLKDLKFQMYLGDWDKLPDFTRLGTPHREGAIEDNLIQVKLDDYKNQFGVVFTGRIVAPRTGSYRFFLTSDDGARILIDGKKVVEHDGIHPAGNIKSEGVKLEKGEHEFRMEYFQGGGEIKVYAAWKGTDFDITPLSKWQPRNWKEGDSRKKPEYKGMPLVVKDEPVLYRNFIAGAGNRGIAVGYPGGINLAWSAESMNLALVWRGAFMDAARHWSSRGGGHQPPLGYDVLQPTGEVTPAFATLDHGRAAWPVWNKEQRYEGYTWKGYTLDAKRFPTFRYAWKGLEVEDTFTVSGDGTMTDAKVTRTIRIKGEIPKDTLFRLATGAKVEPKGDALLVQGNKLTLDGNAFANQFLISSEAATVVDGSVVVAARPEIVVTYTWPK